MQKIKNRVMNNSIISKANKILDLPRVTFFLIFSITILSAIMFTDQYGSFTTESFLLKAHYLLIPLAILYIISGIVIKIDKYRILYFIIGSNLIVLSALIFGFMVFASLFKSGE